MHRKLNSGHRPGRTSDDRRMTSGQNGQRGGHSFWREIQWRLERAGKKRTADPMIGNGACDRPYGQRIDDQPTTIKVRPAYGRSSNSRQQCMTRAMTSNDCMQITVVLIISYATSIISLLFYIDSPS